MTTFARLLLCGALAKAIPQGLFKPLLQWDVLFAALESAASPDCKSGASTKRKVVGDPCSVGREEKADSLAKRPSE
jgi:hypothetical protein